MANAAAQNVVPNKNATLLLEMGNLKDRVNAYENEKNTMKGLGEIVNATFQLVCLLVEKVLTDKKEVETETEDLKNRILSVEFENSSRAIIVKGVPMEKKSNNEKESKMALKSKFEKILRTMKIKENLKIDDIYRILPKETASVGEDFIPPIRVSFTGKLDKGLFMANLSKLKDGEFKDIKIGQDYPKVMLPLFRELDEKAYAFRKKYPQSKTRIVQNGLTLVLLVRRGAEERFEEFDE